MAFLEKVKKAALWFAKTAYPRRVHHWVRRRGGHFPGVGPVDEHKAADGQHGELARAHGRAGAAIPRHAGHNVRILLCY
ncbi:hypothetical protein KL920_004983 [Ogataea angusta]|nr:hypothetical protein KL920_004983 [Ogataea angusta]